MERWLLGGQGGWGERFSSLLQVEPQFKARDTSPFSPCLLFCLSEILSFHTWARSCFPSLGYEFSIISMWEHSMEVLLLCTRCTRDHNSGVSDWRNSNFPRSCKGLVTVTGSRVCKEMRRWLPGDGSARVCQWQPLLGYWEIYFFPEAIPSCWSFAPVI